MKELEQQQRQKETLGDGSPDRLDDQEKKHNFLDTPRDKKPFESKFAKIDSGDEEGADKDVEDFAKKTQEDLSQEVYTTLMKELSRENTVADMSHENLSLLLFMT